MVFKIVMELFQEFIERHKGILYRVAKTYCKDEADRQDLIQEILIQIWQSFHKYNDAYKVSTWLYRISLNVAISFYRKNEFRKSSNVPISEATTQIQDVGPPENEQQLKLLELFISELNDLDKALMLLYLEEKSHAEIAEIMGISATNVSTKVGRIKDKLKQRFSQLNLE